MSDLAANCKLSLSGMTSILTRLETDRFVERVTRTQDARDSNGVLTDTRLARLQQAYPTHLASVRRHVIDYWQGLDLARLSQALNPIAR
jgi:DNA-binding MarR family transcriptional regulator